MRKYLISKTVNYIHSEETYLLDVSVRIDTLAEYVPGDKIISICKKCLNTKLKKQTLENRARFIALKVMRLNPDWFINVAVSVCKDNIAASTVVDNWRFR